MERIRWGNVAKLIALLVVAGSIAFGRGCGGQEETLIPLDELPGEAVEGVEVPPAPSVGAPASHRRPSQRAPSRTEPVSRERGAVSGERAAASPARRRPPAAPASSPSLPSSGQPARRQRPRPARPRIPEAAREFSFDR